MEFFAAGNRTRPIRLSEETRDFAYRSLMHEYGLDTRRVMAIPMDDVPHFAELSKLEQYDIAIGRIAAEAPIRICEGERLSGAATLGAAMEHLVPVTFDGKKLWGSISHLTVDFASVLALGMNGIREKVEKAKKVHNGTEKEPFLRSCIACLDAFSVWHGRYLEALRGREEYRANYENLCRVPLQPARSFYEAVQSIWFTFAFLRLCGNWPGIGRIDVLLGDYLKQDLASGVLTLAEAREILAHFLIKGCEWIFGGEVLAGGDAQHYQNLVLSGIDADGKDVTNEVTYLILDIFEELGIGDFPTTVRINRHTDEKLLRRVAEVMRYGGGILAIYNEDVVLQAFEKEGYDLREARGFANDGCWEVQIPGKTFFAYIPIDALQTLQHTLGEYAQAVDFADFEALYAAYLQDLRHETEKVLEKVNKPILGKDENGVWVWKNRTPCTVVSLVEQGCIETGRSYLEGGPVYNVTSPHIGGLADAVNSLYAIRRLVYEEKKLSLPALLEILQRNWEGAEELRQYVSKQYVYYGNGNDEVDDLAARLLADFAKLCRLLDGRSGYRMPAGVSTFGRQIEWAPYRLATPYGRRAGEVLAANCSPTPNTDLEGPTAVIRSYCKIDHTDLATGSALDIKLLPKTVDGEAGLQALISLIRGFVTLGGFFMQLDVADAALLRDAQAHPENYQTLAVRISGWNARFVTLDRQWQEMVIAQNGG